MQEQVKTAYITIATDASGDFTVNTPKINGEILGLHYKPDATSPVPATGDLSITGATTGMAIYAETDIGSAARTDLITRLGVDQAGTATAEHLRFPVNEQLTVTVANGGDTKLGEVWLFYR